MASSTPREVVHFTVSRKGSRFRLAAADIDGVAPGLSARSQREFALRAAREAVALSPQSAVAEICFPSGRVTRITLIPSM